MKRSLVSNFATHFYTQAVHILTSINYICMYFGFCKYERRFAILEPMLLCSISLMYHCIWRSFAGTIGFPHHVRQWTPPLWLNGLMWVLGHRSGGAPLIVTSRSVLSSWQWFIAWRYSRQWASKRKDELTTKSRKKIAAYRERWVI